MSGISDEQRVEWRNEHYGWDSTCEERECQYLDKRHAPTCVECGIPLAECPVLLLLAEVDTLRDQLRDMEIERNMLRITTGELTERLAGVEERLIGAENVAGYWQLRAENAEARFDGAMGRLEELADDYTKDDQQHLDQFGQHHPVAYVAGKHLRAALSTERGEGK